MLFANISYEVPRYEYVKRLYSHPCVHEPWTLPSHVSVVRALAPPWEIQDKVEEASSENSEPRFCHMRRKPPWGVTFMTNKDLALEVERVSKNSEAERAGLTRGLVLTSVNGARAVRAPDDLRLLKGTKPPLTLGFDELCGYGTPSPTATF
jgi:hypothetical protein